MCHAHRGGWAPGADEPVRQYRPTLDEGSIRVSQAERDAVVSQLSKHTGDGRLTLAEFETRLEEAYAATTRADLEHALRELPREREHPRRARSTRRGWRPPAVLVIVAVIALAMATTWWAMWLLWPGLAWAGGGCGSHRTSTPARDRVDDVIHV